MATRRYRYRKNPNSYWTVYDAFTGRCLTFRGEPLDKLENEAEAFRVIDLLNQEDMRRRGVL